MQIERLILEPLCNNCYILSKNGFALIVDPSSEEDKIEKYLKDNNLELRGILITHYHFDHIGALPYFRDKYKVNVYDYKTLGKVKCANFKFEVIPTKGHSKESVSFYFKDSNDMFVGDFVFAGSIGRMDLEGGDEEEMAYSLRCLKSMSDDIKLYPGHGDVTTLKREKEVNPYL